MLDRESLGYDDLVELIGKPVARAYADDAPTEDSANKDTIDEKTIKASGADSAGESTSENVPLESETLLEKPAEDVPLESETLLEKPPEPPAGEQLS